MTEDSNNTFGSRSMVTETIDIPTRIPKINYYVFSTTCFPWWDANTIEATWTNIGDVDIGQKTHSKK